MNVARRVSNEFGEGLAGKIDADSFIVPERFSPQPVEAQGKGCQE
jgi:hypothetical protein